MEGDQDGDQKLNLQEFIEIMMKMDMVKKSWSSTSMDMNIINSIQNMHQIAILQHFMLWQFYKYLSAN